VTYAQVTDQVVIVPDLPEGVEKARADLQVIAYDAASGSLLQRLSSKDGKAFPVPSNLAVPRRIVFAITARGCLPRLWRLPETRGSSDRKVWRLRLPPDEVQKKAGYKSLRWCPNCVHSLKDDTYYWLELVRPDPRTYTWWLMSYSVSRRRGGAVFIPQPDGPFRAAPSLCLSGDGELQISVSRREKRPGDKRPDDYWYVFAVSPEGQAYRVDEPHCGMIVFKGHLISGTRWLIPAYQGLPLNPGLHTFREVCKDDGKERTGSFTTGMDPLTGRVKVSEVEYRDQDIDFDCDNSVAYIDGVGPVSRGYEPGDYEGSFFYETAIRNSLPLLPKKYNRYRIQLLNIREGPYPELRYLIQGKKDKWKIVKTTPSHYQWDVREGSIHPRPGVIGETVDDEEVTEISVKVEARGYRSETDRRYIKGYTPSSITVSGTVRDEWGNPIPDAKVYLPDLGESTTTDKKGVYRLHVETEGTAPYSWKGDFVLKKLISAVDIKVDVTPSPLEVPLRGAPVRVPVSVQVRDCSSNTQNCLPLKSGRIEVEFLNQELFPFLSLERNEGFLDEGGRLQTYINISPVEQHDVNLRSFWKSFCGASSSTSGLVLKLRFTAYLKDELKPKGISEVEFPLSLTLIKGTTVDALMKPREEAEPPVFITRPRSMIASQKDTEEKGVFYVLIAPDKVTTEPYLNWRSKNRLPLQLPLIPLAKRRNITMDFNKSQCIEIGPIDILAPVEHETRLKGWAEEFLRSMGFDNGNLGKTISGLRALPFRYEVTSLSVPKYNISGYESTGEVQIPGTAETFWGEQAFQGDPPYLILSHELGHFVHKQMIDRWISTCLWDKFFQGGEHYLWRPPLTRTEKGKMLTSFSESAADFFAYLLYSFLDSRHPEFKESIYSDRGYLKEFDTDSKAMSARILGGCRIEGVQTTFLRALYGPHISSRTAGVFGDYLRTADQYKRESWVMRWVPARNILEWVQMKKKYGGLSSAGDIDSLVAKYGINACTLGLLLYPADYKKKAIVEIDDREVVLEKERLVQAVFPGQSVRARRGMVVLLFPPDVSENRSRSVLLPEGAALKVLSTESVEGRAGRLIIDGKITVVTPAGSIKPSGTSFVVEITDRGGVEVKVLEGSIEIRKGKETRTFSKGQHIKSDLQGKVKLAGTVNPREIKNDFFETLNRRKFKEETFTVPATAMPVEGYCAGDGSPPFRTVYLKEGETVTITATGKVKAGGGFPGVGPEGQENHIMNKTCQSLKGLPLMRLIGQFNGDLFDLGKGPVRFRAPGDGWLFIGANDDIFRDNQGSYTVTVRRASGGHSAEEAEDTRFRILFYSGGEPHRENAVRFPPVEDDITIRLLYREIKDDERFVRIRLTDRSGNQDIYEIPAVLVPPSGERSFQIKRVGYRWLPGEYFIRLIGIDGKILTETTFLITE
jgi:hypothetical protein